MAEANAVDPVQARTFVADFVPDPKAIETMAEPDILAYHGKVTAAVDKAVKARGAFGSDWRQTIAEENPDHLKTLERFDSPKALYQSYASLRSKVSAGELKTVAPFPKEGTDDQKNAWRSENGIPAKPEEYKIELPSGIVVGEDDKPFVNGFLQHAHANNLPPQAANAALAFWGQERERRMEASAKATAEAKQKTEDNLRTEWGQEYRPMQARIQGVLDAHIPADSPLREKISVALQTEPEFARFMANVALQINPGATLVAGGAENQVKSITEWLSTADKLMRTDRRAYDKSEYSKDYIKYATAFKNQTGKEWGKA